MTIYSYRSNIPAVADIIEGITFTAGVNRNYSNDQYSLNKYGKQKKLKVQGGIKWAIED